MKTPHARRGLVPLFVLFIAALAAAVTPAPAAERFEHTAELTAKSLSSALRVENLLGSITVRAGDKGKVVVSARIVAEAETRDAARALAESVTLEDDATPGGVRTLRAVFPVARHAAFRMPRSEQEGLLARWVMPLVKRSTVAAHYDGSPVQVGNVKGAAALVVHLDVALPFDLDATFAQTAGAVHAVALRGRTTLEVMEGEAVAEQLYGTLTARSAGGAVTIRKFDGDRLDVQSVSGAISLLETRSKEIHARTGSGTITSENLSVGNLVIESDSGQVLLGEIDAVSCKVETVSGEVDLAARITRTRQAAVKTETGDVTLRVSRATPFALEALAETGTVRNRGLDARVVEEAKNAVKLARGEGGAMLSVTTDTGEVELRPI